MADRLYVLRTGHISMPKRWIRAGGSDEYTRIPVLSFLIVAGDRLVLVDTGCSPEVVDAAEAAWGRLARLYHPQISAGDLVDAQIRATGFDPSDVSDVILTHLHMDHAGGLRLVKHARVWVQRAEHRWGSCPDAHGSGGYFRKEFDLPDLDLHLVDGDAEVADGIRAIRATGHTPGHQSVLVRLPSSLVCIVGDAVYNRKSLDRRSMPALASDTGQYMGTLGRLATLETFFGARLLFSHDAEQDETLPSGHEYLS